MRRTHWLLLATGVLLMVLTTTDWLDEPPPLPLPPELAREPDLYMEDAQIRQFAQNGALQYRLDASRIAHFPARDARPGRTELASPELELHRSASGGQKASGGQGASGGQKASGGQGASGGGDSTAADPPWHVRAGTGTVLQETNSDGSTTDVVYLSDQVQLRRDHPDNRFVVVDAPTMTVYPESQFATTNQPVIITSHTGRTTANGMDSDLARGLLKLHGTPAGASGPAATGRVHTVIPPKPLATGHLPDVSPDA